MLENDLNNLLATIAKNYYRLNSRAKFLIIFRKKHTKEELKHVFATLWSYYIYNVVILTNGSNFVTWYPYKSASKCGTVVNLVTNTESPFGGKIPKTFGKCPVNVTWTSLSFAVKSPFNKNNPGYSIQYLDTIGEKLDLRIVYLTENIDYVALAIQAGNWTHLAQHMKRFKIDCAPVIEHLGSTYTEIEWTKPFHQWGEHFAFPPRKMIRTSWKLYSIFSHEIWLTLIVSFVVMSLFWAQISKMSLGSAFLVIFRLIIQCALASVPRKILPRLTFIIFLLGICNLNWLYLSKLSSELTQPSYEPKIKNIADLIKSDKKLSYFKSFDESLKQFGTEIFRNLANRRLKKPDALNPSMKLITDFVESDYGIILGDVNLFLFKNPEILEVLWQDNIFLIATRYGVRRGFPLLERFDEWTFRFIESGHNFKWIQESYTIPKVVIPRQKNNQFVALNLDHVLSILIIYFVGMSAGFLVFISEVVSGRKFSEIVIQE
ncbi:hypothetical protein TcasGA2_TC011308 [Tribolium castaneum]|uniref:Ionotropic glutamate receptor C-terminal domain-containing protein n=1 Tax=Tribolium castaneum TaxID=7070 RepID=D6X3V6_TRICA|nr:hypothetical protein TcasGA2_TC011308 [Tribolium castaneum]